MKPAILGMEVTTTYKEILPNVALFDEIRSVQPLPPVIIGHNREFRETQKLLTYRFLYNGPPGTLGRKWIPVSGDSASLAGQDSLTAKSGIGPTQGAGPPPAAPPRNR